MIRNSRNLDRWILAQRVGVLAYLFRIRPLIKGECGAGTKIPKFKELQECLEREIEIGTETCPFFLSTLPPSTLHLLATLPDLAIQKSRINKQEYEKKRKKLLESPSPIAAAESVARHILYGMADATSLLRLAASLLGDNWRKCGKASALIATFSSELGNIRSPQLPILQKLEAVGRITEEIETIRESPHDAPYWAQVENVVFHDLLSWPLLVLKTDRTVPEIGAFSLPVAIDVHFDGMAKPHVPGSIGRAVNSGEWRSSLMKALTAAKVLWKGKHGNCSPEFRNAIQDASAMFDFSIADAILRNTPVKMDLHDRSMEAYFAQIILSRFLGTGPSIASVVTGVVGARRRAEGGEDADIYEGSVLMDYEFLPPGGLHAKLMY